MLSQAKVKVLVVHPISLGAKGQKFNLKTGTHEISLEDVSRFDAQAFISAGDLVVLKDPEKPAFPIQEEKIIDIEIEAKEPELPVLTEEIKPVFRRINTKKKGK